MASYGCGCCGFPASKNLAPTYSILSARVQAQRQLVECRQCVEDGARRFRRDCAGNSIEALQACVRLGEDCLQGSETELTARAGGQKFDGARSQVLRRTVVRIDLGQGRSGRGAAYGYAHIGCGELLFEHQLLGVGALQGIGERTCPGARRGCSHVDAWVFSKEGLPDAEGGRRQPARRACPGRPGHGSLRIFKSLPLIEGVAGPHFVCVDQLNRIVAQPGVELHALAEVAVRGNVGCELADGDIVGEHLQEWPVDVRKVGEIVIQIVVMDVVLVVEDAGHRLQPRSEAVGLAGLRAFHGAKLALPDQPLAEV